MGAGNGNRWLNGPRVEQEADGNEAGSARSRSGGGGGFVTTPGRRPTLTLPIIFSTWAATVCSPSLNIRKVLPRLTATRLARCNTSHSPADPGGIIRYWSD